MNAGVPASAGWTSPRLYVPLRATPSSRIGQRSRAEVTGALDLGAHAVTVRASRLKGRLETVRHLVRALSVQPRCAGLDRAAQGWIGERSPLWRKRFLRHVDDCGRCGSGVDDAMPGEDAVDPISRTALGLTRSMIDEKPPDDGHRGNILGRSSTRIGIVVIRDAGGTVWMTHDFAGS